MGVPDFQSLMRPVLELFAEGNTSIKECIEPLKDRLGISEEDAQETLQSGQTTLYNRAHWARTYLGKAGLLESPKRGVHVITLKGRQFLDNAPERITTAELKKIDQFLDWKNQEADSESEIGGALSDESTETPEDTIASAKKKIDAALADELLTALFQMSPLRFERLILDLLQAMGFGRGQAEYRRLTPATGDGGLGLSYGFRRLRRYWKPLHATPFMACSGGGWIVSGWVF